MRSTRLTRGIAVATTVALTTTGFALAAALPAHAAGAETYVSSSDIAPTEANYLGWHEGKANATPAYSSHWDGLHFGDGADSQIINGLVDNGQTGIDANGDVLGSLITGSSTDIVSGDVFLQVAVTFGATGWSTLRPANPMASQSVSTDDNWISTKQIGDVAANTSVPLHDILAALNTEGTVGLTGFGMLAETPAVVSELDWDGDAYIFTPQLTEIPVASTVQVDVSSIRPNEDTYTGWHEGYANETPAYSAADDGLHFGDGADSQIIDGLETPLSDVNFADLLLSSGIYVTSGSAFFQLPVTFGDSDTFSTLRPATGATADSGPYTLADDWISTKAIPATDTTAAIAANTPVALGELSDALTAAGNVQVLAFGVLADSSAPGIVASVVFNGKRYSFVPVVVEPTPTTPAPVVSGTVPVGQELANTGSNTDGLFGFAGLLLLAGIAAVAIRQSVTRRRGAER